MAGDIVLADEQSSSVQNGSSPTAGPVEDDHSGLTDGARIAIPLGLALIAGVFVTLGVQGDLLPRLMRNSPTLVVLAFVLGVIGVVLPLFALLFGGLVRRVGFVSGAVALLVGTLMAIWAAVSGTGIREQPTVSIVAKAETQATPAVGAVPAAEPSSTVQVSASALSLASRDRMLLRVVAYPVATSLDAAYGSCRDTSKVQVDPKSGGEVVYWGEAGPTTTGTGASSITLGLSQVKFRYVCAIAVLSSTRSMSAEDARSTTALVDLRNLDPAPSAQ